MTSRALDSLRQIARRFPSAIEPEMTFAYGSGVFQQANSTTAASNMVDMCLVVDKSKLVPWHAQNLELNPDDYSLLKKLGPDRISALQESPFGAQVSRDYYLAYVGNTPIIHVFNSRSHFQVYFNTLVKISDNQLIKYGVISTEALVNDLLDWSSLYVAGRLHKPVAYMVRSKFHWK